MKMKNALVSRGSLRSLAQDERGLSTVEYVVLLVLIVAACVGLWNSFGGTVKSRLTDANEKFESNVKSEGAPAPGSK